MLTFDVTNILLILNFTIMNRFEMIGKLSQRQNVLLHFLTICNEEQAVSLFKDGYSLCSDALELLFLRRFSKKTILACIEGAAYYDDAESLYGWLCAYLGQDETENFLLQQCNYDDVILQKFSPENLEKYERWDVLAKLGADEILYKHGIYDKMTASSLYKHHLLDYYFQKAEIINPDHDDVLEYLAQAGKWDIVYKNFRLKDNSTNQIMLDFLVKHKQFQMIANENRMYLTTFPEGVDYLQEIKSFYHLAKAGLYDKVDWDEYLRSGCYSSLRHALKAQQWDALMRNHKHLVLLKHFKLWRFIKSFF